MTKLISINVGLPREISWQGKTFTTGIFKEPVEGPVALRRHNLEGDRQADLTVHGGPTKAVYVYSAAHYDYWREELEDDDLSWGAFGENFTVDDADEGEISIGDEFQVGGARLVVTEPRMPCFKLAARFERQDIGKLFLKSQRTGFYFGVLEEGMVEAGDRLDRVVEHPAGLRVLDVTRLYTTQKSDAALLRKAISNDVLPEGWRSHFVAQLERLESGGPTGRTDGGR